MEEESMRVVTYEGRTVTYLLERKQVKNLNLRIHKDCSVYVSASPTIPINKIDEFVISKGSYICAAQEKFQQIKEFAPKPKQYISGESFMIMGRSLRLKVELTKRENIFSDGVYLYLQVKDTEDFKRKQRIVTKFMDQQCRDAFGEIMKKIHPLFQKYGVDMPELRIRNMETRWGSCLAKKKIITLNKQLLQAPRNCIEYVVMHEFCHFIHPDHSKHFYSFLTMMMPDWKDRKVALEKLAVFGL